MAPVTGRTLPRVPKATNASCCLASESPAQSSPLILPRPCFSHQPTNGARKPPSLSTPLYSSLSTHHSRYLLLRLRCLEVLGEIQDQSQSRAAWGRTRRKWDRKFPAPSLSGKGIKRFLRINPLHPSLGEVGKRAEPEKPRRRNESRLQLCLRVKLL